MARAMSRRGIRSNALRLHWWLAFAGVVAVSPHALAYTYQDTSSMQQNDLGWFPGGSGSYSYGSSGTTLVAAGVSSPEYLIFPMTLAGDFNALVHVATSNYDPHSLVFLTLSDSANGVVANESAYLTQGSFGAQDVIGGSTYTATGPAATNTGSGWSGWLDVARTGTSFTVSAEADGGTMTPIWTRTNEWSDPAYMLLENWGVNGSSTTFSNFSLTYNSPIFVPEPADAAVLAGAAPAFFALLRRPRRTFRGMTSL